MVTTLTAACQPNFGSLARLQKFHPATQTGQIVELRICKARTNTTVPIFLLVRIRIAEGSLFLEIFMGAIASGFPDGLVARPRREDARYHIKVNPRWAPSAHRLPSRTLASEMLSAVEWI